MLENNMDFNKVFEEKLAQYTGARYAVCTDCCTNAILISLYLRRLREEVNPDETIVVPARTYMSVPMTLKLFGFKVVLDDRYDWVESYCIRGNCGRDLGVVDAAVAFDENMALKEPTNPDYNLVCLSFQQKKRLNLGRGGAILTNSWEMYSKLKRLVHDGRNPSMNHRDEVESRHWDICMGFHSYLEPDKAARGILLLNQKEYLPPYRLATSSDYPDLSRLEAFDGQ